MNEKLEALARQAAAGNHNASWFLVGRLYKLFSLLDRDTLKNIEVVVKEALTKLPPVSRVEQNGDALDSLATFQELSLDEAAKNRIIQEMSIKDKAELTPEVLEAMEAELHDVRQNGGYSIEDILN
jgi:hypothetical protein